MRRKAIAFAFAMIPALSAGPLVARSLDGLKNDQRTADDVLTCGMGYGNQRYRPLGSINRDTVARLVPVWNYGPDNSQGRAIDCRLGHAMTGSALVPYRTEGLNGVHRPVRARSAFPG